MYQPLNQLFSQSLPPFSLAFLTPADSPPPQAIQTRHCQNLSLQIHLSQDRQFIDPPFLSFASFHVFANIADFHIVLDCSGKFQGESESISLIHLLEWRVDFVSLFLGTGAFQVRLGLMIGFDCLKIHTYTHVHTHTQCSHEGKINQEEKATFPLNLEPDS